MLRLLIAGGALAALAACVAEPDALPDHTEVERTAALTTVTRTHVVDDVAHYELTVRVGDGPNAILRLHRVVRERVAGIPRSTRDAIVLMHGDFSRFVTNFMPEDRGLAVFLAQADIDVWGLDRRWATAPTDGDLSDFGEMGLAQELDDIRHALAIVRATRLVTGSGGDRVILGGFSRGGQLAYVYAAVEGGRPAWQRHVDGLVPLDVYAAIAPEDEQFRQKACANAAGEREALAAGVVDTDNSFFVALGQLALAAPDDPSPLFEGFTNAGALLFTVGATYVFFQPTPVYHLNATTLDETGTPTALRESPYDVVAGWIADASPHQSMREVAESDGLWCGEPPLAVDAPLAQIEVPIFYLGAAGGFGDHGLYTLDQVGSDDVTALVIRRLDPSQEAEDFGHADLLFGTEAPTLAWTPLASWIRTH